MQLARWALLPLRAAVWSYVRRRCPLRRAGGACFCGDNCPETVPETSGGGCNLFCGEVYRLPLDLCQHPGGLAAIVGDGCAL